MAALVRLIRCSFVNATYDYPTNFCTQVHHQFLESRFAQPAIHQKIHPALRRIVPPAMSHNIRIVWNRGSLQCEACACCTKAGLFRGCDWQSRSPCSALHSKRLNLLSSPETCTRPCTWHRATERSPSAIFIVKLVLFEGINCQSLKSKFSSPCLCCTGLRGGVVPPHDRAPGG